MNELAEIGPPAGPMFRVARRAERPFVPPAWAYALEDGTFGNRFDDPTGLAGIPQQERYRVIYCASQKSGAYGETLARYRWSASFMAKLRKAVLAEGDDLESIDKDLDDVRDPEVPERRLVPVSWRLDRHLRAASLDPSLRYVDITHAQNLNHLRSALAEQARELGLPDVDLSAVTSSSRTFTQICARYIYDQGFSGIRYLSRLNAAWERGRFS